MMHINELISNYGILWIDIGVNDDGRQVPMGTWHLFGVL